jgi:hypothetical protein
MTCRVLPVLILFASLSADAFAYRVQQKHPRLLIDGKRLARLPALVGGPLRSDYAEIKRSADAAVRAGKIRGIPG